MEAKVMTPFQLMVLQTLFDGGLRNRNYFFTGGTALSEFYLQHRYSDDLDIFTRVKRDMRTDYTEVKKVLEHKGLEVFSEREGDEFVRFFVRETGDLGKGLKVELCRDVGAQMSPPNVVEGVIVDSFEDIAVNKVCAIFGRTEIKDFVDLFFILQDSKFRLDYLVGRAKEKEAAFDTEDGALEFATKVLGVKDLELHNIRMIKSLDINELRSSLVPEAETIIRRLRPIGTA